MTDAASGLLPAEIIRCQRDGQPLGAAAVQAFVDGVVDGRWGDSQVGAMAMAIVWRGLSNDDTVALTRAMTHSGEVLHWDPADLGGPVIDKHSTGGVGDKVSLILAPLLAACGGVVPMISGRGLGHTGGTLDKLEALPGYAATPDAATLRAVLRRAGCAIVGASGRLAPADRRLYGIRDVTATVESVPLITASILSKKLAAGLQALVMDVKVGNGAFCTTMPQAQALARCIVQVAAGAGLPTVALITDMNQVLGHTAGNALEVDEALDALTGRAIDPRLLEVTLALAAHLLVRAGLHADLAAARSAARQALDSGAAADRFAAMVHALGGPADVLHDARLPAAPVQVPVPAPHDGVLSGMDTRALGLAVVALGGGRRRPGDAVDPRVGLSQVRPPGARLTRGEPMAMVHAADRQAAAGAVQAVRAAMTVQAEGTGRGAEHDAAGPRGHAVVHAVVHAAGQAVEAAAPGAAAGPAVGGAP